MSVVSHHFAQQRKSPAAGQQQATAQRDNVKAKQPQQSLPVAVVQQPGSFNLAQAAREARKGTIGWEELRDAEVLLRKFDTELRYGPATGVSRLERYERAVSLGLNPPAYIPQLLQPVEAARHTGKAATDSIPLEKDGIGSHSAFHTAAHGALAKVAPADNA